MANLAITRVLVRKGSGNSVFELHIDRLEIATGARVALVGPSGCGKSTLLDLLALILIPVTIGTFLITVPSRSATDFAPILRRRDLDSLGAFRRLHTGYILQTGGLLPFVTVRQNIALPLQLVGRPTKPDVDSMATRLGISQHLDKKPAALSSGERQRVAIARALVHRPQLVLADEPTAALDPGRSDDVMRLFVDLAGEIGSTLVVASHDVERVNRFGFTPLRHEFLVSGLPGVTAARFGH